MAALPLRLRTGGTPERGRFATRDFGASSYVLTRKTAATCPAGSVGRGEDDVGRLDDCGDRRSVLKAELAAGLNRDRCDEPLAVDTASSTLAIAAPDHRRARGGKPRRSLSLGL